MVVVKKEAPSLLALVVVRGGAPSVLGRGRSCGEGLQGGDGAAEKNLFEGKKQRRGTYRACPTGRAPLDGVGVPPMSYNVSLCFRGASILYYHRGPGLRAPPAKHNRAL